MYRGEHRNAMTVKKNILRGLPCPLVNRRQTGQTGSSRNPFTTQHNMASYFWAPARNYQHPSRFDYTGVGLPCRPRRRSLEGIRVCYNSSRKRNITELVLSHSQTLLREGDTFCCHKEGKSSVSSSCSFSRSVAQFI